EGHAAAEGGDIADGTFQSLWSTVKLLFAKPSEPVSNRLPILLAALEGTRKDFSFDRLQEVENYRTAAQRLLDRGFQVLVFGHTHLAKAVKLRNGTYINTGTWADLLPFPMTILDPDNGAAIGSSQESDASNLSRLGTFVNHMATAQLNEYLCFMPTYARIELDDKGAVVTAKLCDYGGEGEV